MPTVTCPHCEEELEVPRRLLGLKINCPECSGKFRAEEGEVDEEKKPVSRRRLLVVAVIALGTVFVFGWICLFVVLAVKSSSHDESPSDEVRVLSRKEIVDLIDHPERFKGKTLRAEFRVDSPIYASDGNSLRNYMGQEVKFASHGLKLEKLDIVIRMPTKGELPNAQFLDDLVITFVCREGMLSNGNEAIKVERR